jgi:tetratricopeptide (TPR) repeat protein
MRPRFFPYLSMSLLVCWVTQAEPLWAHGDLSDQILLTTREIEQHPNDAQLYFKRGELHRFHEDWDLAAADFERATNLDPQLHLVEFARAKLMVEAGRFQSAREILDAYIAEHPEVVQARLIRAQVLVELDDTLAAAKDYSFALERISDPQPEHYLERAKALAHSGEDYSDRAIASLDEGIARFGPLVTLQLYAIELELAKKNYKGALNRLDRITQEANRKEKWLAQRGDILRQAGELDQARAAYAESLNHIARLPKSRRSTPAVSQLEKSLQEDITELALAPDSHQPNENDNQPNKGRKK